MLYLLKEGLGTNFRHFDNHAWLFPGKIILRMTKQVLRTLRSRFKIILNFSNDFASHDHSKGSIYRQLFSGSVENSNSAVRTTKSDICAYLLWLTWPGGSIRWPGQRLLLLYTVKSQKKTSWHRSKHPCRPRLVIKGHWVFVSEWAFGVRTFPEFPFNGRTRQNLRNVFILFQHAMVASGRNTSKTTSRSLPEAKKR